MSQRHLELTSASDKSTSKSSKKSCKLQELSSQLMTVQLHETSLAVQLTELKQEALQMETVVSSILLVSRGHQYPSGQLWSVAFYWLAVVTSTLVVNCGH